MSLDNREVWEGSPGKPIFWESVKHETKPKQSKEAAFTQARQMGFSGEMCSHCGSLNTKYNGTCLVCSECGQTTGCS